MIKRLHSNLFVVRDLVATAEFYKKMGFDVQVSDTAVRIKPQDFTFAYMDEKGVGIMNDTNDNERGLGIYTYVEVDDVDAHHAMAISKGITTITEPVTQPYAKREYVVKDPDGYKFVFYSAV